MHKYRVIIIDDEPAAINLMQTIVDKRCQNYCVVATAENGLDGLEKVEQYDPDVVICDIKMPKMDGLELVRILKEKYPLIKTIIVSGYQDFEYVKEGLLNGVCDYILKPVVPSVVQKTLETVAGELQKEYWKLKNKLINQMCCTRQCDAKLMSKAFRANAYFAAIIRINGLPRRFLNSHNLGIYSDENEFVTIYGRDEAETIYLIPTETMDRTEFQKYIENLHQKMTEGDDYATLVYDTRSFPVAEILTKIKELFRCLDAVSTVGISQQINLQKSEPLQNVSVSPSEIRQVLKKLEVFLQHQDYEQFQRELECIFARWGKEKKTQIWMENASRQIWGMVSRHCTTEVHLSELEYMLEDAFCESTTAEALGESLTEIIISPLRKNTSRQKIDSQGSFDSIVSYLEKHLDGEVSLQDTCKRFGISQTYLEKMFRKYAGKSYNQYVTGLRMEKAMQIMKENKTYFVKEIASMVGIEDQFYFSRVFRTYTGMCPTDYMEQIRKEAQ